MKKILKNLLYGFLAYLLVALIMNLLPPNRTDFSKVFTPNSHFGDIKQGDEFTILAYKNQQVSALMKVAPFAEGPPEHVHTNFDEVFSVSEGTLSLLVAGEKKILKAGESFTVSKGTYHKFFNETDKQVVTRVETPEGFAFMLTQLYGVSKDSPEIFASPKFLLQLAAWGSDFDSYLKEGPPPFVVKTIKFLLLPIAKLAGYQYANPAYFPRLLPDQSSN